MKTIAHIRWADPPLWKSALVDLLPLWLFSFTLMPAARLHKLDGAAFLLAIAVSIILLVLRWLIPELVLYSTFPIISAIIFEEESSSYQTLFMLLCTLLLSIGIFGYRLSMHKDAIGAGWVILLVFFIGTWMVAFHANQNYWEMGSQTPWWVLLFSP